MDSRKFVLKETAIVAIGQTVCIGAMFGIFALLGKFDQTVLFGGILSGVVNVLNFLFMAIGASLAADKAQAQDVKGGKSVISMSYTLRLIVMVVILFAAAKSGLCNIFALVIPLVFTRPILMVHEFFRKSGDNK